MAHRIVGSSALALLTLAVTALSQEAAYREVFPSSGTEGSSSLSGTGWQAHAGATATDQTSTGTVLISGEIGRSGATPGLNSGLQASAQGARGFLISSDQALSGVTMLYWTDEFSIRTQQVESFQWYLGNASATDTMRVALAVTDDQGVTAWFASSETFTSASKTTPSFPSQSELKTLLFEGAQFNSLSFSPGNLLSLGGQVGLLPEGTITAFGLYTDAMTNIQRMDTFTINQVPEPSAAMLGIAGMMVISSVRRRRA